MLPDRVSNPGPLTYESGALPIALRGPARTKECLSQCQVWRQNKDIFLIFFKMKVYCVFSLESPHRVNSNKYKNIHVPFSI